MLTSDQLLVARAVAGLALLAALAYALYSVSAWRPTELVVAVGVAVILVPVNLALRHQSRQSPFGPVRKWGTK